jgi:hypothetical protein
LKLTTNWSRAAERSISSIDWRHAGSEIRGTVGATCTPVFS